jgi:2-polyprenyl-6-methoxyphenol hydroxylase-like FAD-dependent oxidoreductase
MKHIAITGAGPAGACLALLLARNGVQTTLIERQTDFSREFRGEFLVPSGISAFDQMGLLQEFRALPSVLPEQLEFYTWGRKRLTLQVSQETFGRHHPTWVSQPDLLEMLVARCTEFPNFQLLRGTTVRDLLREDARVVGLRVADQTAEHELRCDLVVGADGRNSVVRKRSALQVVQETLPMDIIWCKLPMLPGIDSAPTARVYVGNGHLLIAVPVYGNHLQIAWVIPKGSYGDLRKRDISEWMEEAAKHAGGDLAEHLRRYRDEAAEPFLLSTQANHAASWSEPGLLLIGDAAHTMSPVGGQGLNIAIRDAMVAANHLVPAARETDTAALSAAAKTIEAERRPEVEHVQALQERPVSILFRDRPLSRLIFTLAPAILPWLSISPHNTPLMRTFLFGDAEIELKV